MINTSQNTTNNNREKVLLIIPAYNEAENIEGVIGDLRSHPQFYDILVIDDNSEDNLLNILNKLNVNFLSSPIHLGYGGALQLGYKYAVNNNYDTVIQFDADGQHKASQIMRLYQTYLKKEADIIIGSRFLDVQDVSTPVFKVLGNKLLSYLLFLFTKKKIRDITSGFQVLRKKVFAYYAQYGNFPDDYPDVDILAKMIVKGNKISESAITVNKRVFGKSMHSGPYFIIYFFKTILSLIMIMIRSKTGVDI